MPIFNVGKGIEIYYELSGDLQSRETVVFLNGVMASASSWRQFTPVFEKFGYKILLFDFKGQVKSSKPQGPYTFTEHAYELKTLLDFLDINEVNLIGTSYGGEAALKFAILFPNCVRSMVIIDSVSELDEVLRLFVRSWIDLAQTGDGRRFFYGIMPTIYSNSYIKAHSEELTKRAEATASMPREYFIGQVYLYETFLNDVYTTNELHQIKSPTSVVCGEEDILKPRKFSEIIASNIPNAELTTIPDCGHVAIFEKPQELISLSLGFLLKNR